MHELIVSGAELGELAEAVLGRGGTLEFTAHGTSMLPFIRPGDALTIAAVGARTPAVGSVILYRGEDGRLVAHRVVAVPAVDGEAVVHARGDAHSGAGEPVPAARVVGEVVEVRRLGRRVEPGRGWRRWAIRLWLATTPCGPVVIRLGRAARRVGLGALVRLQSLPCYRRVARRALRGAVVCRPAEKGDRRALVSLYGPGSLAREPAPDRGSGPGAADPDQDTFVVATSGGRIVGAASVCRDPDGEEGSPDWWVFGMLVRPRYRGGGIGALLVAEAKRYAAGAGAERLCLAVAGDNRAAVALYRKTGFIPSPRPLPGGEEAPTRSATPDPTQVVMTATLTSRPETG